MPSTIHHAAPDPEVVAMLDLLAGSEAMQSNCMFQLALMVARIATEPCADAYKEETAQALLGLVRNKPKSNVVRLFGAASPDDRPPLRHSATR